MSRNNTRQILLVMKITTFLLLFTIMQVNAGSFAQSITLHKKNITLDQFFREIRKQTGYSVSYSDKILDDHKTIAVSFQATPIESALKTALNSKSLSFDITNNNITIFRRPAPLLEKLTAYLEAINIRGKVVDEQGRGMGGVTIRLKDNTRGTVSAASGEFSIKSAKEGDIVVFSFIGYQPREITAAEDMGTITMNLSNSKLDEVQIQAYGITSQRLGTGDIGTVKAAAIEKQPVTNPLQAIQGRIPGIEITQQTGMPGSAFNVQIRGQNSIANGSDPLYVVDGVPYTMELLSTQGYNILGQSTTKSYGNALNYLNIGEIESIDVLKDADATAIYGSRGANGVILITTKKGKAGPLSAKLNLSSGISKVAHQFKLMNTEEYIEMRKEAFANDNMTPDNDNAYDILLYDKNRYVDWQKELIGGNASFSNAQLSLSGGNAFNQYNVGAIYNRQTTVFPGNFSDKKKGINFNINTSSSDSKFTMRLSGSYLINTSNLPGYDLTSFIFLPPNAPDMVNPDGSLNYTNYSDNYASYMRRPFSRTVNNLVGNATLGYQLLPGLEIKTSLGYTNIQLAETSLRPATSINPVQLAFFPRASDFTDNKSSSWIAEPQATYSYAIGPHKLSALAGLSFQSTDSKGQILSTDGYTSDNQLLNPQAAPHISIQNEATLYRYAAGFARLNYNYADKIILNLSGRRDGSSRFGSDKRFSNFGSIGSAYIFSQEKLIKNTWPWLSFGKLRASYGITGNDQISDYRYMTLYGNYTTTYQDVKGLTLDNLANPELAWERTSKFEIGLDLGFFKDRILLNVNHYRNRSSNQLLSYPLSSVTGFGSIDENLNATVENRGWEFLLSSKNISAKNFSWLTSLNVSSRRNELVKFDNLQNSSYRNTLVIGKPVYIGKAFEYAGVNPTTGVYEFYTSTGTKTSTPSSATDKNYLVDRTPDFSGGITNTINYRRFDLNFTFQFIKQLGRLMPERVPGYLQANQPVSFLNRWQKPGDITNIQKFTQAWDTDANNANNNYLASNGIITDASFIRLKNLSIGYSLPESFLKKIGIKQARISVQGQNLFTITRYKGRDPENQSLMTLPPLFTTTAGLQVTF